MVSMVRSVLVALMFLVALGCGQRTAGGPVTSGSPFTASSDQVIPSVSIPEYLLGLRFKGVFIGAVDPSLSGKGVTKTYQASLRCEKGNKPNRGTYFLWLDNRSVTGEWSVDAEWVHLWIDEIDKKPVGGFSELAFRAPRFVDDGWIAWPSPNKKDGPVTGELIMKNVPDRKYHETRDHMEWSPSRIEIRVSP
jgi:hypothetical protein